MRRPTFDEIVSARDIVYRHMLPTPLYEWPILSQNLGCRFLLKHENHTPTTAFKVRGGLNLVARLSEEHRRRGIIGCTTGNHGQSLAFAARAYGVRCVLVVPAENNPDKMLAMRAWGAEIITHGKDFDEAKQHCEALCEQLGLRYVHSANEPDLIAGVGTYALEVFDRLGDEVDVFIVPVGLGSGICGVSLAAARCSPKTRIIGVQSEGAPAVTESWRQGRMVSFDRISTFAEGLATRSAAELTLEIMREHVDEMVLVSDDELRRGVREILVATHNLAEGAGAAAYAAAWKLRDRLRGKTVIGVLSGGNLDGRELARILSDGAEPESVRQP